LTEAQKVSIQALGALESAAQAIGDAQQRVVGEALQASPSTSPPASAERRALADRALAIGLPFQPTPFVGRGPEVARITNILADPQCRLLTLLGPGGIGKTRLALAVAAAQAGAFADGVAFVGLASVSTHGQIVSAIGETLTLSPAGQLDTTTSLLDYLRDRHMLLVLDNFEHLLAGADLVSNLLARAPRITLLITSRARLNLQAEWLFDVDGLAYPLDDRQAATPAQDLAEPIGYSAVELFVQRARQIQPGFALTEAALAAIVRICQQVAGMPLAIELAATGIRTLPIAAIERQIGANLDVLATTQRDVPARHRSMRAVFDHSWDLLSEPERMLFSNLAVFRGGWTAEATAAIVQSSKFKVQSSDLNDAELLTQNSELLTLLAALVDKSLVRHINVQAEATVGRTQPKAADATRCVMREPIRENALVRVNARPDAEDVRRQHAHYFTALAQAAAAEWDTPTIKEAIARQRREQDNMRAALQWACDSGDSLAGLQLAWMLWGFWRSYGSIGEGRAWLEQLLRLDPHPSQPAAIAARQRGLYAAAWLASDQHDYASATRLFEERAALRRALGETEGEIDLLLNAARQARAAGLYHQATTLYEDALSRHRAMGNSSAPRSAGMGLSFDELGQVLRELGLVLREQGNFARAAAMFEEGLRLHRAIRTDRASIAFALLGLADVARDQGDPVGVRQHGEPSLEILRELGMQWAIGFALNTLALGAYYEGDMALAFDLIEESVALFRALKADGSLAEVLITRGKIVRARGDLAGAHGALNEALRLARAVGPRLLVAASMEGLASLTSAGEHADQTARLLAAAAALRAQMGAPVRPADQAALDQALSSARSNLGADHFAAVWAEVQARSLEQILGGIY
jgi:predicted ATPase